MNKFLWRELLLCFEGQRTTTSFTFSLVGETSGGPLGSFGKCLLQRYEKPKWRAGARASRASKKGRSTALGAGKEGATVLDQLKIQTLSRDIGVSLRDQMRVLWLILGPVYWAP